MIHPEDADGDPGQVADQQNETARDGGGAEIIIPDRHPRGPEEHKALARRLGIRKAYVELLALSNKRDPWYKGSPANWRDANWFKRLTELYGATTFHMRGFHYKNIGGVTATGETHENIETHKGAVNEASQCARTLGLVDPESFEDRKNDPAIVNVWPRDEAPEPSWSFGGWSEPSWRVPEIDGQTTNLRPGFGPQSLPTIGWWPIRWPLGLPSGLEHDWPDPEVEGYDYQTADQPVLIELWIEKSGYDEILAPLCATLGINYVSGGGHESITRSLEALRRAERLGKPLVILYVSDFDPAGSVMPVAVATWLDYGRDTLSIDVEVTLQPIAVTAEQVERFNLPRAPMPTTKTGEEDRRGKRFEAANGEGIVEVDALESLHPGSLAEACQAAVKAWRDPELAGQLRQTAQDAQAQVEREWQETTSEVNERATEIETEITAITDTYRSRVRDLGSELDTAMALFRERLRALAAEVDTELAPFRERLETLSGELESELQDHQGHLNDLAETVASTVEDAEFELPDRPEPSEPDVNREALLYDSRRHWFEQLKVFKRRQHPGKRGWWSE